ncbi:MULTISPECIES: hypothetical protein [Pseudomonas]|nr:MULTISPECIES: hypothetical protein [Pseudomonas]MBG6125559.1 hypothetical protein [Pseudomonas sp. M2]NSX22496.1 hypothetical protein [Pseudomonas putida]HDS1747603.1 hypothetical protein [Pseudomonas putida]
MQPIPVPAIKKLEDIVAATIFQLIYAAHAELDALSHAAPDTPGLKA